VAPHEVGHDRPGAIGRAVVQQNELVVGPDRIDGGRAHAPMKFLESGFLIVARSNDGEQRTGGYIRWHRHRLSLRPAVGALPLHSAIVLSIELRRNDNGFTRHARCRSDRRRPAYGGSRTGPIGPDRLWTR